jgi:hypothetical protein
MRTFCVGDNIISILIIVGKDRNSWFVTNILLLEKFLLIVWDTGHTKGRLCSGGIGQGKETKHLNVVDVRTIQEWT